MCVSTGATLFRASLSSYISSLPVKFLHGLDACMLGQSGEVSCTRGNTTMFNGPNPGPPSVKYID